MNNRMESDSMGQVPVPENAYWGAQTQRAADNFSVSPLRIPSKMIRALGLIKKHAALSNMELGLLPKKLGTLIVKAATEVIDGKWDDHFPIDVFQTGSGTSWNMNVNEVISNRANDLFGEPLGTRSPVHPNDHVNKGQSSNDVIPTAVSLANRLAAEELLDSLEVLSKALRKKSKELSSVIKLGRTHLQDAVPMTLGQEFSAFAVQIEKARQRIKRTFPSLEELAQGGTALGTGINCHKDFPGLFAESLAQELKIPFRSARNKFEAIAACDAQVELMGALNVLAISLMKIANDLRILSSGPRGALGEIVLPSLQPGSSIMPGKVNPVIPEMIIQVSAYVQGKVWSVSLAGQNGPLQLNMMYPLLAYETLSSLELLAHSSRRFAERCIAGIEADRKRARSWIEWSLALVTPLAKEIGYDKASALAYKAFKSKRKIKDVLLEEKILPEEQINELLDPKQML